MAHNNYFQFKQFRIVQEQSAMKVGIDGVLLGAWANASTRGRILDVGTGTGVIALMMAQRSSAEITALEIEEKAASEAAANVGASPWRNRVTVKTVSLQEFASANSTQFDRIVSNPPFFTNASKAASRARTLARHSDSLPFSDLASISAGLLTSDGCLSVILPVEQAVQFIDEGKKHGLHLVRLTKVSPCSLKKPHRYLMEFSLRSGTLVTNELPIRNDDEKTYSSEYKALCKDFYLLF